jgi:hypothetical protein
MNVIQEQTKPVLDEQTFQKVLEAAFVLQEHNRRLEQLKLNLESQSEKLREEETIQQGQQRKIKPESEGAAGPTADYTLTLAEIVETQHQIQTRHLDLDAATAVVAERIARMTHSLGAGIGVLEGATVRYLAGSGSSALPVGTEVPLKLAICQANIRTGQVIRCKDVDTEFLFDPEPVRRRGIRSLVSVPVHYDGNIVGGLELYFGEVEGYAGQDIHTCQLMAGLVTEALGRKTGAALKESMAAERSSMLAAIEKLQPKLTTMAEEASGTGTRENTSIASAPPGTIICWRCGDDLVRREQFCGKCGAPRAREAQGTAEEPAHTLALRSSSPAIADADMSEPLPFTEAEAAELANSLAAAPAIGSREVEAEETVPSDPALEVDDSIWTSAVRAQNFFRSLSTKPSPGALLRFWRSRRGDFYLGLAIVLVLAVIGWGIWSNQSGSASSTASPTSKSSTRVKKTSTEANLSAFDRLLIALGIAEAPDPPEVKYQGNPNTQVWVDLNTAQYYCPGSDLFQKTANGKLTSQRQAQLDQFEPAYRRACD